MFAPFCVKTHKKLVKALVSIRLRALIKNLKQNVSRSYRTIDILYDFYSCHNYLTLCETKHTQDAKLHSTLLDTTTISTYVRSESSVKRRN